MGALHEGHLDMVARSLHENDETLVSLYVNPTQFNDRNDFQKYPRPIEADLEKLRALGVTAAWAFDGYDLYPDDFAFRVNSTSETARVLEGAHRPGHFEGMLTVVLKLLILAEAQRAYFGEKDYQQLHLVKELARAFFLKTDIVPHATVRNERGLALSSRNTRLSQDHKALAEQINVTLKTSASAEAAALKLKTLGFAVDYVEDRWNRRLAAVRIDDVRLIDNVPGEETAS